MKKFIRKPNILLKQEANIEYANFYENYHKKFKNKFSYLQDNLYLSILDKLFLKKYSFLDVGCGSGISYRLLNNYKDILGVDFSKTMIQLANKKNFKKNIKFEKISYEKFNSKLRFYDAISLSGVYGRYVSWLSSVAVIKKSYKLLKKNGILIISYVPPISLFGSLKSTFFPKSTYLISKNKIVKIFSKYKFSPFLFLETDKAFWIFFKK